LYNVRDVQLEGEEDILENPHHIEQRNLEFYDDGYRRDIDASSISIEVNREKIINEILNESNL
jgi:hypothetical protein